LTTADVDKKRVDKKKRVWEEISNLIHIGRTPEDVEQTLLGMGYEKSVLKEILTVPFMETLLQKEHAFVELELAENNLVAEQKEKKEQEELTQKIQEQELQLKKIAEELLKQNEEVMKNAAEEKKRADLEEQRRKAEDLTKLKEENKQTKAQEEMYS